MCKNGLGINNIQWLICHKTKPNQTEVIVAVRVQSMCQIDLFENYLYQDYSIPCKIICTENGYLKL